MINILFISDTPQAEQLRAYFQARFQTRFVVVSDYDHGLKDVFEKRPSVVFIQEQIAGVTGESVAKHIQLLLGDSAPSFVLVHDANSKAKACPGLFNHLLSISLPPEELCQGFDNIMRALLKDAWLPIAGDPVKEPEVQKPSHPPDSLEAAMPLPVSVLSPKKQEYILDDVFPEKNDGESLPNKEPVITAVSEAAVVTSKPPVLNTFDDDDVKKDDNKKEDPLKALVSQVSPPPRQVVPVQRPQKKKKQKVNKHNKSNAIKETPKTGDELLTSFEKNYQKTGKTLTHWILLGSLVAAACFAALSLYLVWSSSTTAPKKTSAATAKAPMLPPEQQEETDKGQNSSEQPAPIVQALPSFIPVAGIDPAFSKASPGWTRYMGKGRDYRIFMSEDRIKALQIIATGQAPISSDELNAAMMELFGFASFKIHSRKEAGGLLLERATMDDRGELLLYRTQAGGPVRALVLTVN